MDPPLPGLRKNIFDALDLSRKKGHQNFFSLTLIIKNYIYFSAVGFLAFVFQGMGGSERKLPMGMVERILGRINEFFVKVAKGLCIYLLAVMTAIVLTGVFFRYVLNNAIPWTEEVSKFLMIWMALMGAPVGLQMGTHVGIEALKNALRGRPHFFLLLLGHLIILSLLLVWIKEGLAMTQMAMQQTASSIEISLGWIYLAIPVGSLMMLTIIVQQIIQTIRQIIHPTAPRARKIDRPLVIS
jgi:TRAP-type C4-dicarboxylate transport system permease small subunit